VDPKEIVRQGYDMIAEEYARQAAEAKAEDRDHYTQLLLDRLPPGSSVLELGCGAGLPVTGALAERFVVTGVDISGQLVELARRNAPAATFLQADMTQLDLLPESYDAVAAFYCIPHVPRREQEPLLRKIQTWLKPGGWLVASFGPGLPEAHVEQDWMGVPMYFSAYDRQTSTQLIEEAGLEILSATEHVVDREGEALAYLWIVAKKPLSSREGV